MPMPKSLAGAWAHRVISPGSSPPEPPRHQREKRRAMAQQEAGEDVLGPEGALFIGALVAGLSARLVRKRSAHGAICAAGREVRNDRRRAGARSDAPAHLGGAADVRFASANECPLLALV